MNTHRLIGLLALTGMFLGGCQVSDQAPLDRVRPHEIIAQSIDFSESPDAIASHYTEDGQNWLRMAFPDVSHRHFALKSIGKAVPNVDYTTLKGSKASLGDIKNNTLIYFTQSGSGIVNEMNEHMEAFKKEHKDIDVLTVYLKDTEDTLAAYEAREGIAIDPDMTVIGKGGETLQQAFDAVHMPLLIYVDHTQTIAYTAIGFRDLVYLNDHAESAFGEHPFYNWMNVDFDA